MKIRRLPKKMEEFMVIPPDFGMPEEKRIDRTIKTIDDVICISEEVQRLCLEQGIRIVYGIADDIDYQNILGMNVLTIHI